MRRTRWLQRAMVIIPISGQLSGCTSWHLETLSPADVIAREKPSEVRVEPADERYEVLYRPEVRGDSLLGRRQPNAKQSNRIVALTEVKGIETRRLNAGRTTGLVLGIVGIGAVIGMIYIGLANMQGPLDNWGQ